MNGSTIALKLDTAILRVGGMQFASEQTKVGARLEHRAGVAKVEVNPVAQTATITYDTQQVSVEELQELVSECGYHCSGQALPQHLCTVTTPHANHDGHTEWVAVAMSGSSSIVATNALLLKRLHLPTPPETTAIDLTEHGKVPLAQRQTT